MKLQQYTDVIVELGERSNKEFMIEQKLDDMETKWDQIFFEFMVYKDTAIIKGYDNIT